MLLLICSVGIIFIIYPWMKKECQTAYMNGATYGSLHPRVITSIMDQLLGQYSTDMNPEASIWIGHDKKGPKRDDGWEYVGIGNEKYTGTQERFIRRGKGFWWAEHPNNIQVYLERIAQGIERR